ncbi:hypothetical protein NP233_g10677 [Leucocoprinus birnbaumii]|uniref:DUF6533 domain-containing protein n=1 Tax=Leucocoprinus birnbaumii TaxID=56174 RepID=A0AAD5YRM8_9AGAR|nr:hypothetical protein NP233_g10677 [Leucocoprinus birnbaumii]
MFSGSTNTSPALKVASITVLLYDYVLTLDLEIKLIWGANWNLGKVLYLLTRYLPFFDTAVVLYYQFSPVLTSKQCAIAYEYSAYFLSSGMFVVGMSIAELLLTIRTWAVWEKSTRLGVILSFLYMGFLVAEYLAVGLYLKSLRHEASPLQPLVTCFIDNMNRLLSVCWIVLMAYDAGLSCLNAIIILKLPLEYVNLLSLLERIAHALLTCRIILHIRQFDARNARPQELEEIALMDLTA